MAAPKVLRLDKSVKTFLEDEAEVQAAVDDDDEEEGGEEESESGEEEEGMDDFVTCDGPCGCRLTGSDAVFVMTVRRSPLPSYLRTPTCVLLPSRVRLTPYLPISHPCRARTAQSSTASAATLARTATSPRRLRPHAWPR